MGSDHRGQRRHSTQLLGQAAESLAADLVRAQGLRVIARNFCCRAGELDLVCCDGDLLVVIEVRRRTRTDFGGAAGSVGAAKQRRIRRATLYFLAREPRWRHHRLRFDVIAVSGGAASAPVIEWLRDAFRPG